MATLRLTISSLQHPAPVHSRLAHHDDFYLSQQSDFWASLEHGSELRIDQSASDEDVEETEDHRSDNSLLSIKEILPLVREANGHLVDPAGERAWLPDVYINTPDTEFQIGAEQPDESSFAAGAPTSVVFPASWDTAISAKGQNWMTENASPDPDGGVPPGSSRLPRLLDGRFATRPRVRKVNGVAACSRSMKSQLQTPSKLRLRAALNAALSLQM